MIHSKEHLVVNKVATFTELTFTRLGQKRLQLFMYDIKRKLHPFLAKLCENLNVR
jgi:hypothetical protein